MYNFNYFWLQETWKIKKLLEKTNIHLLQNLKHYYEIFFKY